MEEIIKEYNDLKTTYDAGDPTLLQLGQLGDRIIKFIQSFNRIEFRNFADKNYSVIESNNVLTRPFREDILFDKNYSFEKSWYILCDKLNSPEDLAHEDIKVIDNLLYKLVMSFAVFIDIKKPKSRKTPGTFFEVIMGSVIHSIIPDFERSKHIPLPLAGESISTDIVFSKDGMGLVFPIKISTRERVVQPYAHQRILNSVFGEGKYKSVLICANETQRDDKKITTNDICVPGTIKLFQSHLAKLYGIYYLDPPSRYLKDDVTSLLHVNTIGHFLVNDIRDLIDKDRPTLNT